MSNNRGPSPPLANQLFTGFPKAREDVDETLRAVRNQLRKYNATSVVEVALQLLWRNVNKSKKDVLQGFPWLVLLLVKWALQDKQAFLSIGPDISVERFAALVNRLWNFPRVDSDSERNIFLMLRGLMHAQLEFQRPENWGFMRWPALYARLDNNHKSRVQFRTAFGMEPDAFRDLTYGLYAAVLNGEIPFHRDWLGPWRVVYGGDVDRIYAAFIRDLPALRTELQSDLANKVRGRHELIEFPYLKRYPLLRLPDGRVHCWHPLVFARGAEDAVHLRLSAQFDQEYTRSFSRVYERYVTELAVDSGLPHLDEATMKRLIGSDASSVEVVLEQEDCNVLVEAKLSLFGDEVLLHDDENSIFLKTNRVREAITQGWTVGRQLREHKEFKYRFQKPRDFLLVVTSRDLLIGSGEMLKKLYAPGSLEYPDEAAAERLPLTRVFVLGIEDYEHLMGCVRAGEVKLSELLSEAEAADKDFHTQRLFISDFLGKYTKRWTQPRLLTDARDAAEQQLARAFGVDPDEVRVDE